MSSLMQARSARTNSQAHDWGLDVWITGDENSELVIRLSSRSSFSRSRIHQLDADTGIFEVVAKEVVDSRLFNQLEGAGFILTNRLIICDGD